MKKASVLSGLLYSALVIALGGVIYLQHKTYQKNLSKKDEQISLLQDKLNKLQNKLTQVQNNLKKLQEKEKKVITVKKEEKKIPKGSTVIKVKVPKVPKVPKVITLGGTKIKHKDEFSLSMEMPVEKEEVKKEATDTNKTTKEVKKKIKLVGIPHNSRVSTYLISKFESVDKVKEKLTKVGFKIIGEEKLNNNITSIVFTNDVLKDLAKKSPFIGNLRVIVDKKDKQVNIENPVYFAKAFLQESYDEEKVKEVLTSINQAFDDLKNSSDQLKYTLLPKYQFMFGLPYYQDMVTVKEAKNSDEIISKISKEDIIFSQKIDNDTFVLGIKLSIKSEKFIDIIGNKNSFLLPYPLLVKNGVAKILNPKYYIAISYPMLKMSQFMKISSVPDEIESDFKRILK